MIRSVWAFPGLALITVGFTVWMGVDDGIYILLLLLGPQILGFTSLVACAVAASAGARRKWGHVGAAIVFPICAGALTLSPEPRGLLIDAGQALRFELRHLYIERQLAAQPANGQRFLVVDWGGALGINNFLIYDETDQIAQPANSLDWSNDPTGVAQQCAGRVVPHKDHYYWCSF